MASTQCSECDEEIEVAGRTRLGQKIICNHCGAQLEVVATEPLEVEIASEDDDELWDEEEDDDLDDLDEELVADIVDVDIAKQKVKENSVGKSAIIEELDLEDDLDIEDEELEELDDDELEEEDDLDDFDDDDLDDDFDDDDFEEDDLDDFDDDDDDFGNDRWR